MDERHDEWAQSYICPDGCAWDKRCPKHAEMMSLVRKAWEGDFGSTAFYRVCEVSSYPEMAGDWSGVRDSTPTDVERMHAVANIYRAVHEARKSIAARRAADPEYDTMLTKAGW